SQGRGQQLAAPAAPTQAVIATAAVALSHPASLPARPRLRTMASPCASDPAGLAAHGQQAASSHRTTRTPMTIQRMTDLDLTGKRVLIRQALNVPVEDGRVTSDQRITASLPTLRAALDAGAAVM